MVRIFLLKCVTYLATFFRYYRAKDCFAISSDKITRLKYHFAKSFAWWALCAK